jgi:hypothetical protein
MYNLPVAGEAAHKGMACDTHAEPAVAIGSSFGACHAPPVVQRWDHGRVRPLRVASCGGGHPDPSPRLVPRKRAQLRRRASQARGRGSIGDAPGDNSTASNPRGRQKRHRLAGGPWNGGKGPLVGTCARRFGGLRFRGYHRSGWRCERRLARSTVEEVRPTTALARSLFPATITIAWKDRCVRSRVPGITGLAVEVVRSAGGPAHSLLPRDRRCPRRSRLTRGIVPSGRLKWRTPLTHGVIVTCGRHLNQVPAGDTRIPRGGRG